MRDPVVRSLTGLDVFSGSSRRQLRSVLNLGTFVDVPAGRVVCREGAASREFFVVVDGIVELDRAGETVAILLAGEAWGEPRPVTQAFPHAATATARTRARLLVYNRREYLALLSRCPAVARTLERAAKLEVPYSGALISAVRAVSRSEERWLVHSGTGSMRPETRSA